MTGKVGTPIYMAPELLEDDEHCGPGIDVYAFAILAYEIVTGIQPFSEKGKQLTLQKLMKKVSAGERPEFPDNSGVTEKMKDLITSCWSANIEERPSFEEIFEKLSNDFTYFSEDVDSDEINDILIKYKALLCRYMTKILS